MVGNHDREDARLPIVRRPVAWIYKSALAKMAREATRHSPNETGGTLVGYWSGDLVVCDVIGAGPLAQHEPARFVPDHDFQVQKIADFYWASSRQHTYLGDWHTHPGGLAELSRTDRKTLGRIRRSKSARAPRPAFCILAGEEPWAIRLWVGIAFCASTRAVEARLEFC